MIKFADTAADVYARTGNADALAAAIRAADLIVSGPGPVLIDEFQHVPEILDWAAWLLGLSAAKISSRDPAVLTEFGHLVETFAAGEILKQVSWSKEAVTAAYFRTQDGDEVDLVLETSDGRVAGFEVKAGSRVQDADLNGLRLLRDRLGERFIAGFLLNSGNSPPQGGEDHDYAAVRAMVLSLK